MQHDADCDAACSAIPEACDAIASSLTSCPVMLQHVVCKQCLAFGTTGYDSSEDREGYPLSPIPSLGLSESSDYLGEGVFDFSAASGQADAVQADDGLSAGDTVAFGADRPLNGSISQQRQGTIDSAPDVAEMPNTDHSTAVGPAQPSVLPEPAGNPPPPPASHADADASAAGAAAGSGSLAGRRRLTLRRARSKQPAASAQQPM